MISKNKPFLFNSPWLVLAMMFLPSYLNAQQAVNPSNCSTHFQARANWLRGLDGQKETIDLMESYAELLWISVPRDCGMFTGFSQTSCRYRPNEEAVLNELTSWAAGNQGLFTLPLCMEDPFCSECTGLLVSIYH